MKRWLTTFRTQSVDGGVTPSLPTGAAATSDEELLRRFVVDRDDRAFGDLVGRHGGMVMGVCRRLLGQAHDAEDAFQAVFLVLARKADTLRRAGSLPAWLHKTAFRIGLRARAVRGRRREQATEDLSMIAAAEFRDIAADHDRSIVDEELSALPERYRLPLFLCCVEGKSLDAAARQLGWSVGSVKGRLERGRAELRRRLLLRRVPFALGLAAVAVLAPSTAFAATVSPSLIAATVQAGMQHAVGRSALGYVSQNALTLTRGSWKIMSLTAAKIVVGCVTLVGIGIVGAGRVPGPAHAAGDGGVTLEASFAPSDEGEIASLLALADAPREGEAKAGPRDGDKPRTGPRDGEKPRTGPRDGDTPRREGEVKRDGDAPRREGEAKRDGDAPRREAETRESTPRTNPLDGFKPQTEREEILVQMILGLQRELTELRRMVQARDGGNREGAVRRDGEPRREGVKDGTRERETPKDAAPRKDG
jgi:RNA polymerase sigma factor (sigma-70 family)